MKVVERNIEMLFDRARNNIKSGCGLKNNRPDLPSEGAPDINKTKTV
jgi:hypothetical protein